MKKFAVSVCIIALLVLTAADSLRGVDRARELADFEHEDRGLNSEGINAKYDQALESREDARALEEYEQYYRALEEQLRFLEDEEDEDGGVDSRRLQEYARGARFAPTAPLGPQAYGVPGSAASADVAAATRGGVGYPAAYFPATTGFPAAGNTVADARARAQANTGVAANPAFVQPAVLPAAGNTVADARARAQANTGVAANPAFVQPAVLPAAGNTVADARARAQANTGVAANPAFVQPAGGTTTAEAAATSGSTIPAGVVGGMGLGVPLAPSPAGSITQHSFGDNSYASRTVGPGFMSSTAMAGSPRVGATTIREGVVAGPGPASGLPAYINPGSGLSGAAAEAAAATRAGVGVANNNLLYGTPYLAPAGAVDAQAAARARTGAVGGRPALSNPAGLTYFPATSDFPAAGY